MSAFWDRGSNLRADIDTRTTLNYTTSKEGTLVSLFIYDWQL
jgi:hypothetical protein